MRPRGSVISQLLLAFAVFAVLVGVAAAAVYLATARQDTASRQLTEHDYVLQAAAGRMQDEFNGGQMAISGYALSGRKSFLVPVRAQQAAFDRSAHQLAALAPARLAGLTRTQQQAGARLFTVASQITRLPPRSAAARALATQSAATARSFFVANERFQAYLAADVRRLTDQGRHALAVGLAWSAAAIAFAVLLVLSGSLSTMRTVTGPLRALAATVRSLTAGDYATRATVTGSAEVREVAQSVNAQADEADRLRAAEAESGGLRAVAREAGLRIREHLVADDVLAEARLAVAQNLRADVVYLRLIEGDRLGPPLGLDPEAAFQPRDLVETLSAARIETLTELFRAQASRVIQDVQGPGGEWIRPDALRRLREAGVVSVVITPFGVRADLLGIIVAIRVRPGRAWTRAEVDAAESIAADLGRGLNQARLYESENRLVAELKSLERAKSDFFATISHELRAPLTTIEGYVEMLAEEGPDQVTEPQRKMLDSIERSAVRLRNLIDDVFTLAKLESGADALVTLPVSMPEVIAAAAEAMRPSVAAAKLSLTCATPERGMPVTGDAGQLERVMINLLSNAVKFTPEEGHITVAAASEDEWAVITVTDSGIGIPERDQKELFTRFFRASNARERAIPGTGLGLAIVRTIVISHGGEVDVDSREGSGTTVTLRLPLRSTARA
jgi:signal transduction histidine kinase/HAMP domain-containing protein